MLNNLQYNNLTTSDLNLSMQKRISNIITRKIMFDSESPDSIKIETVNRSESNKKSWLNHETGIIQDFMKQTNRKDFS